MKKIKRKRKILISWIFTYCLVLLVTVISMFITYYVSKDIVKKENVRNNTLLIDIIKTEFDEILQKIEKNVIYISSENHVNEIAKNYRVVDNETIYKLRELKMALQSYNGINQKAVDYYVYFGSIDKAVSSNDIMDSAEMLDKYSFYMNRDEWKDLISTDTGNNLVLAKTKNGDDRYIYVMHSYYTNKLGESNVSLVYILSKQDFNFMTSNKIKGMNFYINRNDSCTVMMQSFDVDPEILEKEFDKEIFKKIGGKYLYSACMSNVWNVKYVILSCEKDVFFELEKLKKTYLAISIITLLIGLAMAYYFAKENYNSIEKISESLSVYVGENDDISTLKGLSDFAVNMVKNYTKVVDDNIIRQEKIQKEYIRKILHTNFAETETLINEMKLNNIEFLSEKFAVMVVQITDSIHMLMNYSVFINLINEVCSLKHSVTVVEENGFIVCLINFCREIDNHSLENDIVEMKNAICSVSKNGGYVNMSFASSGIVEGVDKIYLAFTEAMSVMDYKTMHNENDILFLKDIQEYNVSNGEYYSQEQEKNLIKSIVIGNIEMAQNIVTNIIQSVSLDIRLMHIGYKCVAYDILSSMMKAAYSMGNDAVQFMIDNNIKFEAEIKNSPTREQYINVLNRIVCGLCSFTNDSKNNVKSLEELVMENIYKNYTSYDLSLSTIAEDLGFHPVYLSSSFKSQYGEGVNSRIEKVRLGKAFELLESGESVSRTAEMVGYVNVQTFSKSFKRKYGVTPSSINQKNRG